MEIIGINLIGPYLFDHNMKIFMLNNLFEFLEDKLLLNWHMVLLDVMRGTIEPIGSY